LSTKALSREEHRALLNHHVGKLRLALSQVDVVREPLTAAQAELTAAVNAAKADLGKAYTRKRLMSLVEDTKARMRNLMKEEEDRHQDRLDLALPVYGQQQDLFGAEPEKTPAAQRDAIAWEAEGFMVGRHAGDREAPDGCAPEHIPAFLKGYDLGQAENGRLMVEAMEAKKRLNQPDAEAAPVNLTIVGGTEMSIAEEKAAERKSVRKAKASLDAIGEPSNEVPA
jgi:hypothetical protein